MSDIQYVYPLIHNKVTSPHYVTPTLRRARLLDWLHGNASCRAVVIAADAGYGKTTLLWQWEREVEFPCYWYKMDRNDRDWSLHISYLIEAVSQRHPGFGRRAHSMLQQLGGPGSSRPGVAAHLLGEMYERLTEPCTFIIDDWQFVASVTEVRGLWNQILRDAPPTCRFVFLSRAKPRLQFARFKTHGGYAEMRTDALRFTDRETEELFRDIYHDPLDPAELVQLERRTEGWAASLQLVEVSLRERKTPEERRAFIESITASEDDDIFSFLAEEVLEQQPASIRDFLLCTSIPHQITPELAERLSGAHDGAAILRDLEFRGLFTNQLDGSDLRFRYHGLFREFLLRQLEVERTHGEVVGLHIHAASYFETKAQWPEAIVHYLRAGLHPQAARLAARYGEDLVTEGRIGLIDEWLQLLPRKTVRENARLSLLGGEVAGIRGDWKDAIAYLDRARLFFRRKGDRRMEALALLKISTVHSNRGAVEPATVAAREGLELAPEDAHVTRLRLEGNLAITSLWMSSTLPEVTHVLKRIAVEAASRGYDHLAAIAHHNLGVAWRHIGEVDASVKSLTRAALFWSDPPASPLADNLELVLSLLAQGRTKEADLAADTASSRTAAWPKPHAEALLAKAAVLADRGRWSRAIEILERSLVSAEQLGPTGELLTVALVECLFLTNRDLVLIQEAWRRLAKDARDPRHAAIAAPAEAIAAHAAGVCNGACFRQAAALLRDWERRGANRLAAAGFVKLGALAVEHSSASARQLAQHALRLAAAGSLERSQRHWLRRYRSRPDWFVADADTLRAMLAVVAADPDGWRHVLVSQISNLGGASREQALALIARIAARDTAEALATVPGADVAEVRRRVISRQAATLFVRSFGALTIQRGSWKGRAVTPDKKRLRALLGLLVASSRSALTREMALERLWPEADPTAAVNSLNQTVFQLRRVLDADYRDGASPPYVLSNADLVQLNPDLVRTDLEEFRLLGQQYSAAERAEDRSQIGQRLVDVVRGEYLADLRYEDWATDLRPAVHAEVRSVLLPIAATRLATDADLAIRAGCALLELDPYDDDAAAAVAGQYANSGRRPAARDALSRYAARLSTDLDEPLPAELAGLLQRIGESTSS